MDCSMPGIPVLHHLPELAQTHVQSVGAAIQPSSSVVPFSSWGGVFSNESALWIRWPEYWSFSFSISPSVNIEGWFPLGLTGLISLLRHSQESSTPQFKSINSSALSLSYGPTLTSAHDYWKNHSFLIQMPTAQWQQRTASHLLWQCENFVLLITALHKARPSSEFWKSLSFHGDFNCGSIFYNNIWPAFFWT